MLDLSEHRVCITGGAGFLGRAVCSVLRARGVGNFSVPRSNDYDLTTEWGTSHMFHDLKPDVVIHLAAEVGGIGANQKHPGRYFYANMAMGLNVIELAREHKIRKLIFVSTVCAYPHLCPVPFIEDCLWDGYPEETNAPYGIAKRAMGVMLDGYKREYGLASACLLLANMYGPHDNFSFDSSHVIPAMINRFSEAVKADAGFVECWGSGRPSREFLYVDDAAEAIVRAAERIDEPRPINIGTGIETRISELAETIAGLCGYQGGVIFDSSKPDGQPRRRLDVSRAQQLLGWKANVLLRDGLAKTVEWYLVR